MTPIERAAQALADAFAEQEPEHGGTYFLGSDNLRAVEIDGTFDFQKISRAVLQAIREPSEAMVGPATGYMIIAIHEYQADRIDAQRIWKTMIDAAIAEGP